MEAYIKYKRIDDKFTRDNLQKLFDELVAGGWEIIFYSEKEVVWEKEVGVVNDENGVPQLTESPNRISLIPITIVAGKKQNNVL